MLRQHNRYAGRASQPQPATLKADAPRPKNHKKRDVSLTGARCLRTLLLNRLLHVVGGVAIVCLAFHCALVSQGKREMSGSARSVQVKRQRTEELVTGISRAVT